MLRAATGCSKLSAEETKEGETIKKQANCLCYPPSRLMIYCLVAADDDEDVHDDAEAAALRL